MAELKTKLNKASVGSFLQSVKDEERKLECMTVLALMKKITKAEPAMWGDSIVGFGSYHYKSDSGREGDWFITGFSPRKQNLPIYIIAGFTQYPELMKKLGKFKTGSSCLYIRKLADIDMNVLEELIGQAYQYMKKKYKK